MLYLYMAVALAGQLLGLTDTAIQKAHILNCIVILMLRHDCALQHGAPGLHLICWRNLLLKWIGLSLKQSKIDLDLMNPLHYAD